MINCDEAKFYLTQCGLTRLDGDGDGVPCGDALAVGEQRRVAAFPKIENPPDPSTQSEMVIYQFVFGH